MRDRNGAFLEPFGEGDNCIDVEGDRFNGRRFGKGHGRFGDESGSGGFGPDDDRVREDRFRQGLHHNDFRPDDQVHGDWEHGAELDGRKHDGSDESGGKQSDGKHAHGKSPKSDAPRGVREVPPRAFGEFNGFGSGAIADGEKFGDFQPKYIEGEESGGHPPRADGEQTGDRPKSPLRNSYYPIKYDSYHRDPKKYSHRTPHDTRDFSPLSPIRSNKAGFLGGTSGLTGVAGLLNGANSGVLGPLDSNTPAKRTTRLQ
jgi:hypothetical protein